MKDAEQKPRKVIQHQNWLNRQSYRKHFGSQEPVQFFRNWSGNPDPCGCGCGLIEYGRSDPANWWQTFSPKVFWKIGFLFPVFRSLFGVLGALRAVLWGIFTATIGAKAFKVRVISNLKGTRLDPILAPTRLLGWLILCFFLFALWVLTWVGDALLIPLYFVSFVLVVSILLVAWTLATIYIMSHGILFLIGGAASILYLSNPIIGILLIAAGVALEYESKRRRDRQHREEIGKVLRLVEDRKITDATGENREI